MPMQTTVLCVIYLGLSSCNGASRSARPDGGIDPKSSSDVPHSDTGTMPTLAPQPKLTVDAADAIGSDIHELTPTPHPADVTITQDDEVRDEHLASPNEGCRAIEALQTKALANWRAKVARCSQTDPKENREIVVPEQVLPLTCLSTRSGAWGVVPRRVDLRNLECALADASALKDRTGQPHTSVGGTFSVVWSDGVSTRTGPAMPFTADLWGAPTCGGCPWPGLKGELFELLPLGNPQTEALIGALLLRTGPLALSVVAELFPSYEVTVLAPKGDHELVRLLADDSLRIELGALSQLKRLRLAASDLRQPLAMKSCPFGNFSRVDDALGVCVDVALKSDLSVEYSSQSLQAVRIDCMGGREDYDDYAKQLSCAWLQGESTAGTIAALRTHCRQRECTPMDDGEGEARHCANSPLCSVLDRVAARVRQRPPFAIH